MPELTSPFGPRPLDRADADHLAGMVKALADPTRLQLLGLLWRTGEATVVQLVEDIGTVQQPTISHHLQILIHAGLVSRRREGVFAMHELVPAGLAALTAALNPAGKR
jgi:ArsR family transcriptional regulator